MPALVGGTPVSQCLRTMKRILEEAGYKNVSLGNPSKVSAGKKYTIITTPQDRTLNLLDKQLDIRITHHVHAINSEDKILEWHDDIDFAVENSIPDIIVKYSQTEDPDFYFVGGNTDQTNDQVYYGATKSLSETSREHAGETAIPFLRGSISFVIGRG